MITDIIPITYRFTKKHCLRFELVIYTNNSPTLEIVDIDRNILISGYSIRHYKENELMTQIEKDIRQYEEKGIHVSCGVAEIGM